jgi:hypothetical protein
MMTSRFVTPPELIPLENDFDGYHLPQDVAKSWKTLEQSCCQITTVLRSSFERNNPKTFIDCSVPPNPSKFGYSKDYSTESKARIAISQSVDAFVLLFAYVSFCIAICRVSDDPASISLSTSTQPRWLQELSAPESKIHPEFLQLLVDSPIADFTTTPQRLGTIINVSQCSWISLVPCMMIANIPIWLYWGIPPLFVKPLVNAALEFAPRSHPHTRAPPLSVITSSQPVSLPTPSQPVGLPTPSQPQPVGPSQSVRLPVRSAHAGPGQLPGETWNDFLTRQSIRRTSKLSKESVVERQAREDREKIAAKRSCPGKKGPTVFIWEDDNGVWKRTLVTRAQVERNWGNYRSSQKIYNSIDNCWDLCFKFDEGTAGEVEYEYDSNDSDSDNDTYRPEQFRRSPTPHNRRSGDASDFPSMAVDPTPTPVLMPAQVASDSPSTVVDPTPLSVSLPGPVASDPLPMDVDSTPLSVSLPGPVASDPLPMDVDSTPLSVSLPAQVSSPAQVATNDLPHSDLQSEGDFAGADEDDEDPYDASRQDVLNAYSFVPLNLEPMPITTLDDLLYYRFGFSLNEEPYTKNSSFKAKPYFLHWDEVCRSVGGRNLPSSESESALNNFKDAVEDFLSFLATCKKPFKEVPGKYWDLSPLSRNPIVDLSKVFISINEMPLADTKDKWHFITPLPRFLHPERDSSWFLSVDSMTALECIRRGLGPHSIDIANFLITHGVRFRTFQHIQNSPNSEIPPVRPHCRYLGYRSLNYTFDVADFAGYQVLRDSFLLTQPHGPLALREGGIIARLAREVLPNSNALSGPSSDALSGHHARHVCDGKIYVEDEFSDAELRLICGTYELADTYDKGIRIFLN